MDSMSRDEISKMADCIAKIIITFLSVIFIPMWMNAESKIGLDNYIGDHSLKLPWNLIMILMPLIFLASYYTLYLYTKDLKNCSPKKALFLRILICLAVFMSAAYCLIELTQFPGTFDKYEFQNVLLSFLTWSFLSIIIASDAFIKNKLEKFIDDIISNKENP
jgi:hypothetical protein